MADESRESIWTSLKNRFPWKDMFFGFLVPKVFFLYGARHGRPFLWGGIAITWCVAVFYLKQVRNHKVNFFAIFAVIMILARVVVVLVESNPRMYLYVLALDNFVVGFIFMASLHVHFDNASSFPFRPCRGLGYSHEGGQPDTATKSEKSPPVMVSYSIHS